MVYVSITGLKLKHPLRWFQFWWHAIPSMIQAKKAHGNLRAEARNINGVHHTLTVWIEEAAMRDYVASGAHLKAMKAFKTIATGKTLGFASDTVPDWSDIHAIWLSRGKDTG